MALRSGAEDLISALLKAEASLEQIAHKLEEEAEQRCKAGEVNPFLLVKRVRRLASEMPELQAKCRDLLSSKQGLIDAAQRQLAANHTRLRQLCDVAGAPPADEEAFRSFQETVGEWNQRLQRHALAAGAGHQLSRQDLNAALARTALA
ncbi:hypothetical protein HYH03_007020 [Edaphochlamys debaryana]|uniref:Protein FAM33A n=1 Tax=Edaphochlamys debaryana TaxID=47281 RepID=A0A835Y2K5_9CHLO|nr:hypothetical protein HYH03_007020 [Edaphochlamys debaryana]|eukprot:KAG2494776.1 hypothetical protein HYH03_007020 [Edaphochlamys debaryana]